MELVLLDHFLKICHMLVTILLAKKSKIIGNFFILSRLLFLLCREVDKIFQKRVRFIHILEENRKQTTTILCLLQQRHIQEDWKLERF